jgi:GNAT superfamily N-acetyltransferase
VRLRRATAADADRIAAIEAQAYAPLADGERATRARLAAAGWTGVLEADGTVAGYAINAPPAGGAGLVQSLGVATDARGRGFGRLLLTAAAYQLATTGARRALVRARPDLPRSTETAVAAGFRAGRSAVEFRRTLDEAAIAARLEERQVQGMKVRFGEWR